jgi:hypothetical protein
MVILSICAICRPATDEARSNGAGDGTRTRGILLGKQVLYQLSYTRLVRQKLRGGPNPAVVQILAKPSLHRKANLPSCASWQRQVCTGELSYRRANLGEAKFAQESYRRANLGEAKFAQESYEAGVQGPSPWPSCKSWRSQVCTGAILERVKRFELSTSSLARKRSSQLSYTRIQHLPC